MKSQGRLYAVHAKNMEQLLPDGDLLLEEGIQIQSTIHQQPSYLILFRLKIQFHYMLFQKAHLDLLLIFHLQVLP